MDAKSAADKGTKGIEDMLMGTRGEGILVTQQKKDQWVRALQVCGRQNL